MSKANVKLGLLPPLSGVVGIYGSEITHAAQVACQEINDNGGVLGRRLEIVIEDDGSLPESAVTAAEKLIDEHHCSAIIGNLLSNARIAVAYRVAEPRHVPYLNFSFYEGSILSPYFFHFAALPNQQIDKMIPYMCNKFGPRMFFAGNNYEWPRGSIHAGKLALEQVGGEVVGEEYTPIGVDEEIIDQLLDKVEKEMPDVFVPYFAGSDQVLLLTRFTERGLKNKIAVVMGHYDEMMASQLSAEVRNGFYSSNTYFMTIDSEQNRNYLSRLADLPDVDGIWPKGNGILTNFGEGTYVCVKAFAAAANKAGSLDPELLAEALRSIQVDAPQGKVTMLADHQHAEVNTYLTQCNAEGEFNIVESFGVTKPALPERYNHQRISRQTTMEDDIRLQARMLEQLSEGIMLIGTSDNLILYANTGANRMFGYNKSEMNNLSITSLIDPSVQNPDDKAQEILSILEHKGEWEGELQSIKKNGKKILCSIKVNVFTHPVYGEVWLSAFRDITQRKRSETKLATSLKLSQTISDALASYMINPVNLQPVFERMLDDLLTLTGSEYGFIGDIKTNNKGERYLRTYAITNIAWNDETRKLYDQYGKTGFEFTNLHSLFGITILNDEVVISNDPSNDKRRGGLPKGHPALNAYMGVPLMAGNVNVGMIGIANRKMGYNQQVLDEILPLLNTFSNIIMSAKQNIHRENIDNELRENEASLSAAQSIAHVGSWNWDIQTGALRWSDEIYRIFGLEPQAFPATYDAFLEHIHPDDIDAVTAAVSDAVGDERKDYNINHRIIRKSGEVRYVHEKGIVFTDDKNNPIRMLGAVHDITEQINSQHELNQFKSTLDKTSDCVFIFKADESLRFTYANSGAKKQIGYGLDEMLSMTPYDIKPYFTEQQFREFIRPMLDGESDFEFFETIHRHKDGHDIPVEIGLQYISSDIEENRFIAVVRDISERKKVEAELAQYRDNLEELVKEKTHELHNAQDELVRKERLATLGQLTATVGHELRNPLGAMRPSLYIIEKKTQEINDEKLQSAVERINRNISRCDRIIDELLDFTRITGLSLSKANFDEWLNSLIQEQNIHDDIKLDWQPGLGDYVANIDFDRVRRAVINVIENGGHAMLKDDDINHVIADARLTIRTFQDNERINIQVTDTGSGIPEDVLPQIFTPLYSTKGFGVGLGMPTVKQILEQHSGGIEIDTCVGKGTTVTLWLPHNSHHEVSV